MEVGLSNISIEFETKSKTVELLQKELINEYDCELGKLEVERLLDFVIDKIGADIHNAAIDSAIKTLYNSHSYVEEQLDLQKIYE